MNFNFNPNKYDYPSQRRVVYAKNGMVCTGQPLAAQAGLAILQAGGNAIDAAITTAITLTVVEPTGNGLGSEAFCIAWVDGKLYGMNASGYAPELLTREAVTTAGYEKEVPKRGWIPVMVPGAPAGWAKLHKRFGKLPFAKLFEPAIRYAQDGFPLSPTMARLWEKGYEIFKQIAGAKEFEPFFETFAPNGKVPKAGEIVRFPDHAKTLRLIADTYAEAYYHGEIADAIDKFSRATGGYLRKSDLENYEAQWVEPISTNYRGYDVWELPPNGHGVVALMALNILQGFDFSEKETAETYHKQIEAMKLAFIDGMTYVADPRYMKTKLQDMLSQEYAAARRNLIEDMAIEPQPGDPFSGGTVYLCTADNEGNMVSFIQSNFMGFGSGIVIPGYGIALNNRGQCFKMDPAHDNCLAPHKKPYHTIIPGFLTKDGKCVGPFGVMGGYMQPQGHVQVMMNTIDFAMNPQQALDAPRWQWVGGKKVEIEASVAPEIIDYLKAHGHEVILVKDSINFGRGQIIFRDDAGVLVGATEPRTDGVVACY
ncbi:MAG: gamma-glutamyltransferase family protein [Phascolarctobacterium sp.]|nr:gamma-glutamyltransferase family protein [Phascolarctobacterium sp.]